MGDLALVASDEITAAGKVWLQLIPRIEYRPQKIEFGNKGKFNKFTPRPQQKAFNPNEAEKTLEKGSRLEIKDKIIDNKIFFFFRKQLFRKGFLYKQFTLKQIDTDQNVRPGIEEV